MKVSNVSRMRELDRTAMDRYGISDELLMENAGLAVFQVIQENTEVAGRRFCIFCGGGNNGGDGFVIARKLYSNGAKPKVFLLGNPEKYKGAARLNYGILSNLPVNITPVDSVEEIISDIMHCHAIVDAIFGTGLTRDVEGKYARVIDRINRAGKTVFSVDIPSGINGDTGKIMGVAVKADFTVTFGLAKLGNMLYPGFENCGRLYVTHISFPPEIYRDVPVELNTPIELPKRAEDGHKSSFGQALFIAGAAGYYGAPYFSAMSFLKAGGGYARLASPRSITPFIANKGSEIVFVPQDETSEGTIAKKNKKDLLILSERMDFVVLGPGLSLCEQTQQLARELAAQIEKPLLIDGDGITALSTDLSIIRERKAGTILTPHPGEMARITGKNTSEIDQDKVKVVQETARDLNAAVVLKGAHSLIGLPDNRVFINTSGNSGMGSAGSGDVLTGTIGAMYCLGLSLDQAVRKGVFIHGFAGDLAAEALGKDGMTAQDILEHLPMAMDMDRDGLDGYWSDRYAGARLI